VTSRSTVSVAEAPVTVPLSYAVTPSRRTRNTTLPALPTSSSTPSEARNREQPLGTAKRMSEAAWTPRPFGNVTPSSVIVRPSAAPDSPLDMSLSTGPHAFVAEDQVRPLRYLVSVAPSPKVALSVASAAPTVTSCVRAPPSDQRSQTYSVSFCVCGDGAETLTAEPTMSVRSNGVVCVDPPTASWSPLGCVENVIFEVFGSSRTDAFPVEPPESVAVSRSSR
jgi:hypothetical protein